MQFVTETIPELSALDDIERLETYFFQQNGFRPNNVSYWNPSPTVGRKMAELIKLNIFPSVVDYSFSYELATRERLLANVGLLAKATGILVTPSGSTSILMVVRYLAKAGINSVALVCPTYFTVPANLSA